MGEGERRYSDEEMEEILRRALSRQQVEGEGFEHDELVAAALEVGLDRSAIDQAIEDLREESDDARIVEQAQKRKRSRFGRSLLTYLIAMAVALTMLGLGYAGTWVLWMAVGWGSAILLRGASALRNPTESELEREVKRDNRAKRREAKSKARRNKRHRQRKRSKQREREGDSERGDRSTERARQNNEDLERVIEEGVGLLLSAATKKLRKFSEDLEERQEQERERERGSEFAQFVARERGMKDRGQPAPDARARGPLKVRVPEERSSNERRRGAEEEHTVGVAPDPSTGKSRRRRGD